MRTDSISRAVKVFAALALAGLAGCPSPNQSAGPPGAPGGITGNSSGTGGAPAFRAALVLDTGGVDDKSFNAAANAGLQRAKTELGLGDKGIGMVESNTPADYKTNLTTFA